MIAFARSYEVRESCEPAWHSAFLHMLPAIRRQLRFAFRKIRPEERAEAMAEAIAAIAVSFARLHEQGKVEVAFPSTLVDFAVRHYFAGRRVANQLNVNDVSSPYAQRQRGFRVKSLDQRAPNGEWRETLVEDKTCGPADLAASRIDLDDWLDQLPSLKRKIAETLARGESTSTTAQVVAVTPGRISQVRRELESDWAEFQGELLACA